MGYCCCYCWQFFTYLTVSNLNYLHICALILSAIILNAEEIFSVTCLHWVWYSSTDCVFTFMNCIFFKNFGNICLWVHIAVFCSYNREIHQYWENSDRYIWHRWRCTCWICPGGNRDYPGMWKVSNWLQWTAFYDSCDINIILLHWEITNISYITTMGLYVVCVHMHKHMICKCACRG